MKYHAVRSAAISGLLTILTASLFSYPFHVFLLQIMALSFLTLILFSVKYSSITVRDKMMYNGLIGLIIFSFISLAFYNYTKAKIIYNLNYIGHLSRIGFKDATLKAFSSIRAYPISDGSALYLNAKELYNQKRLYQALSLIQEAKNICSDNRVYRLSGDIHYELGNLNQAEKDYKIALYMVPNRIVSRKILFEFYLNIKDTSSAKFWGRSILSMPIKVPSPITASIKSQTESILISIYKRE